MQNIKRATCNRGQELYDYPHSITENINGNICTSDYSNEVVVVVKKSGQLLLPRPRVTFRSLWNLYRCPRSYSPYTRCVTVTLNLFLVRSRGLIPVSYTFKTTTRDKLSS